LLYGAALRFVQVVLPCTVPASLAYLHSRGCYLLDNGQLLVLWVGREAAQDWLVQVGVALAMGTMRKQGKHMKRRRRFAPWGSQERLAGRPYASIWAR
jgi:hypothetical protein